MSVCSPAGAYKEDCYCFEEMGYSILEIGGNKVYVHPSVPDDDIHQYSVVGGGMPLHVLLLDCSLLPLSVHVDSR